MKELDLTTKDKKKGGKSNSRVKEEGDGFLDDNFALREGEESSANLLDESVEGVDEKAEKKRLKKEMKKRDKKEKKHKKRLEKLEQLS